MSKFFLLLTFLFSGTLQAQDNQVVVRVSEAVVCFGGQCHPALVGANTRPGTYDLSVLHVAQPGYGPHVLQYDRDRTGWYAIHQTYHHGNVTNRHNLYYDTTPDQRTVSAGCINVEPHVYQQIYETYRRGQVVIVP